MTKIQFLNTLNQNLLAYDIRNVEDIYTDVINGEYCLPIPSTDKEKMIAFISLVDKNFNELTELQYTYIMRYCMLHSIAFLMNLLTINLTNPKNSKLLM